MILDVNVVCGGDENVLKIFYILLKVRYSFIKSVEGKESSDGSREWLVFKGVFYVEGFVLGFSFIIVFGICR